MLWAATAVVVTIAAAVAIGASLDGGADILSEDQVSRELGADPGSQSPSAGQTPDGQTPDGQSPGAAVGSGGEVVSSIAGSLVVRCTGTSVSLLSWSPNPGYRADDAVRGPATEVSVWFESDSANDVKVVVTCPAGQPNVRELVEQDDHGGNGGNSGPGGGD